MPDRRTPAQLRAYHLDEFARKRREAGDDLMRRAAAACDLFRSEVKQMTPDEARAYIERVEAAALGGLAEQRRIWPARLLRRR